MAEEWDLMRAYEMRGQRQSYEKIGEHFGLAKSVVFRRLNPKPDSYFTPKTRIRKLESHCRELEGRVFHLEQQVAELIHHAVV